MIIITSEIDISFDSKQIVMSIMIEINEMIIEVFHRFW